MALEWDGESEIDGSVYAKKQQENVEDLEIPSGLSEKVGSSTIDTIWSGTSAAYTAITTKDPRTLYLVSA